MSGNTRIPGNIIRSGSVPTTALGGGVVSSSAQTVAYINNQTITPDKITASGDIVPSVNESYNLGSPTLKWKDLYLSGSTIYLGTLQLKDQNGTLGVVNQSNQTLPISGSFTGSLFGTSSLAENVEYEDILNKPTLFSSSAQLPSGIASSSAQVKTYLPTDTVSSSAQVTTFLPAGTVSSSTQLPAGIASSSAQVTAYLPVGTVSSSGQVDFTTVSNKPTLVSASSQVDVRNTTGIATIATTGSNTITGITTFSETSNSTSYLDGSIRVAGGMSIQKDLRISGSMTINGVLSVVSMSSQYVTSSQYNVGVSKITLNDDDNVRFAGMSIYDSGSSSPASASIYWDSMQHRFIYENLSGSSYNSAILIAGPKNTGSLGSESTLSSGYLPYATGDDHIDNSVMYQSGSSIGIGTSSPTTILHVNGGYSGSAANYSGNVTAATLTGTLQTAAQTNITSVGTLSSLIVGGNLTVDTSTLIVDSTNNKVGIGNTTPVTSLDVNKSSQTPGDTTPSGAFIIKNLAAGNSAIEMGMGSAGIGWLQVRNITNQTYYDFALQPNAGNVGIGTMTPRSVFHVRTQTNGNLGIANSTSISGGTKLTSYNDTGTVSSPIELDGSSIAFNISSVEKIRIDTSGSVGIGTTNPLGALHIAGGSGATGVQMYVSTNAGYTNPAAGNAAHPGGAKIILWNDTGTPQKASIGMDSNADIWFNNAGAQASAGFTFYTGNGASATPAERLKIAKDGVITMAGNVGIGTTNPSQKLHVFGDALIGGSTATSTRILSIETNDASSYPNLVFKNHNASATVANYISSLVTKDGATDEPAMVFAIGTVAGGALSNRGFSFQNYATSLVRITPGGNVGIGTTSPGSTLSVSGANTGAIPLLDLKATGTGTFQRGVRLLNSGMNVGDHIMYAVGRADGSYNMGQFYFYYAGAGSTSNRISMGLHSVDDVFNILGTGNVGIGTTNPQYKLSLGSTGDKIGYYSSATVYGSIELFNGSTANMNFVMQNSAGGAFTFTGGNVLPGANGTQNLGSTSLRWSTVYTSDLSLSNGIGDWTIVEGEEDLFIYNNKNNKVYKFTLQEVDPSIATPKKS